MNTNIQRELDPYIKPAVAWVKHRFEQEQRPVLVACESVEGCDKVGDLLSEVGSVTVVLDYMNNEAIGHVMRDHERDGKPTVVVSTIQRIGYGVLFSWPSAYITSTAPLRIEAAIQLMARPRPALLASKVLAYFPLLLPSSGMYSVESFVNSTLGDEYTLGGECLKQFGFDEQIDKSFSYNFPRDSLIGDNMADKTKTKKAGTCDLKALAICEAFTLAEESPRSVWVAKRKKPDTNIGWVESINLDTRKALIGIEGKGRFEHDLKSLMLYSKPKKAKLKYPTIHNKLYTVEHVHNLISRAIRLRQYRDQWDGDNAFSNSAAAHFQLKAIVELLENIVVFNVGDGMNGFKHSLGSGSDLSARLDSFIVAFHYQEPHNRGQNEYQ